MYKLLIVDDNRIHIRTVLEYVNWESYKITDIRTAENGISGFKTYMEFKPDMIVTDVVMPSMDGLEMVRRIREIDKKVKIVFMSCYDELEYLKSALDSGVTSYVLKPINPEMINDVVKKLIGETEIVKKSDLSDKLMSESFKMLKESFLHRILYSKHLNNEEVMSTGVNLGFSEYKYFTVLKFFFRPGKTQIDWYDVLSGIEIPDCDKSVIMETEHNIIMVLMSKASQSFDSEDFSLLDEKLNGTEYSIGISNEYQSLEYANLMLEQANRALENAALSTGNSLLYYNDVKSYEDDFDISEFKKQVEFLVENPIEEETLLFVERHFEREQGVSRVYLQSLCYLTVLMIKIISIERNIDLENGLSITQLINKINDYDSILDARQWITNVLLNVQEAVRDTNVKSRQEVLVDKMEAYINQNYMTISNIAEIAAGVYISASYAKTLFKKYRSTTIFEYLTQKRMNVAKNMLLTSNLPIYDISEKVGYSTRKQFVRIFKRYTGVTPSVYQKQKGENI